MHKALVQVAAKRRLSVWLCIASIVIAATMMHPTWVGFFSIGVLAVMIFTVRAISQLEGHADANDIADRLDELKALLIHVPS